MRVCIFLKIVLVRILLFLFFLVPNYLSAKEQSTDLLNSTYSQHIIDYNQVIYGSVVVFILLAVFIFVLKKFRQGRCSNENFVQIVSSYPLSTKEKLQVIRIGQEYILIGVTGTSISKLHQLSKEDVEKGMNDKKYKNTNFSGVFSAMLSRFNHA